MAAHRVSEAVAFQDDVADRDAASALEGSVGAILTHAIGVGSTADERPAFRFQRSILTPELSAH